MYKLLTEFCNNSTIHGVRYFAERRRHWSERLWWMVAFSLSLYFCSSSVWNIWQKWQEKPTTIDFTETEEPISSIPFPTITICPQTKTFKQKLDINATYDIWWQEPKNLSDIEINRMEALYHICPSFEAPFSDKSEFVNSSIYEIIEELAIPIRNITVSCEWREKKRVCSEFLQQYFTDDGLCFVFNALNSHEMYTDNMARDLMTVTNNSNISNWSFENGYTNGGQTNDYPYRIFNTKQFGGYYMALQVSLEDIEYMCAGIMEGFKLSLTVPGELRRSTTYYFQILLNERAEIFIKSKMVTTSEKLRSYTPNERQCFFNSERQLRFFKIYTQNNCEAECLANFTKRECGCVKLSMPRDESTKICGIGSGKCYENAEQNLFGSNANDELTNDTVKEFRAECHCLPSCTSIRYDAYIDRTKFDYARALKSMGFSDATFFKNQMAIFSVYFSDPEVSTLLRSESQTYTDFFAICGGLLGLFLGVSVLSIIEFIYFLTLRMYWTIRRSNSVASTAETHRTNEIIFDRRPISCITIESLDNRKKRMNETFRENSE